MRLAAALGAVLGQVKGDARFRRSVIYGTLLWMRHPRYAALKHREARFYGRLLERGRRGLIFDLGASTGSKAEILRRHGRVICVEPSPSAASVLRTRFAHCRDVEVLEAAVSNRSGRGTLWEFAPASAYNTLSEKWASALQAASKNRLGLSMPRPVERTVRLITIDELMDQYGVPRYIKIDVEGLESLAVQGMSRPCELLSAEFNLPEFEEELAQVICRLEQIGGDVLFNAAITEPPVRFEFAGWLSGSAAMQRIHDAGWRYVELFCRASGSAEGRPPARRG